MTPHDYYNYLAHYGVLGMKWGVRKDRKTLAKHKRKAPWQISDEEVRRYRSDVDRIKKHGFDADFEYDQRTGNTRLTEYYHKGTTTKLGKEYGDMIIKQALKETTSTALKASAAVGIGATLAMYILGRR